jgi:2-dehydro-3-deoxyphosphogluconate aldolase/(4S)-4-hydroxy-2-oxoglutarate aldolase
LNAHEVGADFVKIFPVRALGLDYIKDIKGPINHVKLIATAGVTPDNISDYLDVGFSGFGISNYLTDKTLISEKKYSVLTEHAENLLKFITNQ